MLLTQSTDKERKEEIKVGIDQHQVEFGIVPIHLCLWNHSTYPTTSVIYDLKLSSTKWHRDICNLIISISRTYQLLILIIKKNIFVLCNFPVTWVLRQCNICADSFSKIGHVLTTETSFLFFDACPPAAEEFVASDQGHTHH